MDDLRSMVEILSNFSEIYKINASKNARHFKLCTKYATISQWISIGTPIIYSVAAISYQLPALVDILINILILPDINELDVIDLSVLLLINITLINVGVIILSAYDPFVYLIFSTIPMYSTIIQREINDLTDELKVEKTDNNSLQIKKQLIKIINMQLEYNA